jgi:hypothetical protein
MKHQGLKGREGEGDDDMYYNSRKTNNSLAT